LFQRIKTKLGKENEVFSKLFNEPDREIFCKVRVRRFSVAAKIKEKNDVWAYRYKLNFNGRK
jgi:hypothetical protein